MIEAFESTSSHHIYGLKHIFGNLSFYFKKVQIYCPLQFVKSWRCGKRTSVQIVIAQLTLVVAFTVF